MVSYTQIRVVEKIYGVPVSYFDSGVLLLYLLCTVLLIIQF